MLRLCVEVLLHIKPNWQFAVDVWLPDEMQAESMGLAATAMHIAEVLGLGTTPISHIADVTDTDLLHLLTLLASLWLWLLVLLSLSLSFVIATMHI